MIQITREQYQILMFYHGYLVWWPTHWSER